MGWFKGWFSTRWYKMLYTHRGEEDAAELVLPLIAKGELRRGQSVLDMACGRGRHAAILARKGMQVTGIDLSAASIQEAARVVPAAHFEVFDIRVPYASDRFDAVVCLFTSLGYTKDRQDDQRAVTAAAEALKSNGLFVLDLLNGDLVSRHLVPLETKVIDGVRFRIERKLEGGDIVKRIQVEHPGGKEQFEERVHAWSLPEVTAMITKAGLVVEDVTDGTCRNAFDPERSNRIITWARKKQ
ncbi:MAG: class I SAM-dependent methyltransferase [Flavobacteriales bacterium]|jgi:SAM-dependent methyltransferase|nr:class I SAM-dependent methyltransferase [Flavobacteriales bacterium]MCB0758788.1 methyltransferase domain-containing protein [Flavobacteriales bacterium]